MLEICWKWDFIMEDKICVSENKVFRSYIKLIIGILLH